jgi:acetyl-CoA carboxylase carboxyltransferase component
MTRTRSEKKPTTASVPHLPASGAAESGAPASPHRAANLALCEELVALEAANHAATANALARQHAKNKLSIPERLGLLFDPGSPRTEVGEFAGHALYAEHGGGITAGGVRVVIGQIEGRRAMVVANDSMVKAGAWFPITIKKMIRAQEIALENRLPCVYLVDSAGVFLPMQEEIFPDRDHAGRIFYNNSRLSAAGIPQVAAIMGPCVAGGAYLPILCDETLIVKGTGSVFLAGPFLVEAAIGEKVDAETLGGATTHTHVSGVCDYEEESEQCCLARIRAIARAWPEDPAPAIHRETPLPPAAPLDTILDVFPPSRMTPYRIEDVLARLIDAESLVEYKANYGKTLWCGTARLDGWAVGIVANQRGVQRSGGGEMQIGGVIYSDSADKAARFVLNCNQKGIPILWLHDVTGFMVGTRAEKGGIIKDGAKLVNAISNSRVPQITLVMGSSNGAGNYAMCGRAYGARFMFAWPHARIGVMGGAQAGKTLLSLERQRRRDDPMSAEEEKEFLAKTEAHYEAAASPYYAAARLWIDAVIDPRATRATLAELLAIVARAPLSATFSNGVMQT